MKFEVYFLIGVIFACASKSASLQCDRKPDKFVKPLNKVNIDRYVIEISGNPNSYTPGENYIISLKSNPASPVENRFYKFILVAEPESPSDMHLGKLSGNFDLIQPLMTMFHNSCPNTIIESNTLAKTNVMVSWKAPSSGSGCIAIRATVIESSENWFMDDGGLTKILCEENEKSEDVQPDILEQCCACSEAKYEVAFQRLWSRNTHPKDFPQDVWKTKLGDVIGASHKYSKSFWNYGDLAGSGLKLLGEEGDTSELEKELKEMVMSDDIRTIIKAREISHQKTTEPSYTVFRVDQDNHLISLVSKIIPSPDWIVGVANLELCLDNCSWAESRTLNLYPWDVGTDDGLAYESPDIPSRVPQLIRRIKSNSPNTDKSPFYSPDGEPIKPLAKLYLTRQKLYEKECQHADKPSPKRNCKFGNWSEWSSCSVTCGKGVMTRDRPLLHSKHYKQCLRDPATITEQQQTVECEADAPCEDGSNNLNDCPNTEWGPWTKCSDTCPGFKERLRQDISDRYKSENNENSNERSEEEDDENHCSHYKQVVRCSDACAFGNDLESGNQIKPDPNGDVIDCELTNWSIWSSCDISQPCTKRYKVKERLILVHPQNGGKPCPKKLQKKKKCRCKRTYHTTEQNPSDETGSVDCEMGPWTKWSPCTTTCGYSVRQRTRTILVYPSKNGKACESRIQEKKCPLPIACDDHGMSGFYR